jgi:2,5-diamino-6-(ribosylamino)-4(3H)-pyrimidinone 5'-phosphate reductase
VSRVRVDAGGVLNRALLSAGLVDEISVVVAPYVAAGATAGSPPFFGELNGGDPVSLDLTAVERLRQGHLWLRYEVRTPAAVAAP